MPKSGTVERLGFNPKGIGVGKKVPEEPGAGEPGPELALSSLSNMLPGLLSILWGGKCSVSAPEQPSPLGLLATKCSRRLRLQMPCPVVKGPQWPQVWSRSECQNQQGSQKCSTTLKAG